MNKQNQLLAVVAAVFAVAFGGSVLYSQVVNGHQAYQVTPTIGTPAAGQAFIGVVGASGGTGTFTCVLSTGPCAGGAGATGAKGATGGTGASGATGAPGIVTAAFAFYQSASAVSTGCPFGCSATISATLPLPAVAGDLIVVQFSGANCTGGGLGGNIAGPPTDSLSNTYTAAYALTTDGWGLYTAGPAIGGSTTVTIPATGCNLGYSMIVEEFTATGPFAVAAGTKTDATSTTFSGSSYRSTAENMAIIACEAYDNAPPTAASMASGSIDRVAGNATLADQGRVLVAAYNDVPSISSTYTNSVTLTGGGTNTCQITAVIFAYGTGGGRGLTGAAGATGATGAAGATGATGPGGGGGGGCMTSSSQTVSGASSITFASIPATCSTLILDYTLTGTSGGGALFQFNGDTGANYDYTFWYTGTSQQNNPSGWSSAQTSGFAGFVGISAEGWGTITVPGYASSTLKGYHSESGRRDNSTQGYLSSSTGDWRGTAAITSIVLTGNSGGTLTGTITLSGR